MPRERERDPEAPRQRSVREGERLREDVGGWFAQQEAVLARVADRRRELALDALERQPAALKAVEELDLTEAAARRELSTLKPALENLEREHSAALAREKTAGREQARQAIVALLE